jgi:arsenate reductase
MAEGFAKHAHPEWEVFSAGTKPEIQVNKYAVIVMNEIGIDISSHHPKNVNRFVEMPFDRVITVCDNAKEICPVFTGKVGKRLHIGFEDPADATGSDEEKLIVYRKIRDQIRTKFENLA